MLINDTYHRYIRILYDVTQQRCQRSRYVLQANKCPALERKLVGNSRGEERRLRDIFVEESEKETVEEEGGREDKRA